MEENNHPPSRWQLFRDVIAFQFKLAMDGLRDLLLSPISIIAGLAGLILSPSNPGKYFNQLLELGRKSDIWINLFGASEHYHQGSESSDAYIERLEELLKKEYQRGGVVRNIKDGADHIFDQIQPTKTDKPNPPQAD